VIALAVVVLDVLTDLSLINFQNPLYAELLNSRE